MGRWLRNAPPTVAFEHAWQPGRLDERTARVLGLPLLAVTRRMWTVDLVTAPAWPAHPEWLAQFLRVLGTKIEP